MSTNTDEFSPYGDATFCEDIRNEVGGQISLIGVYRSDIIVPSLPYVLPKFGISVTIVMPPLGKIDHEIRLSVFVPGDQDSSSINVENSIAAKDIPETRGGRDDDIPPHVKIIQQFIVSPFEISVAGFIKVRVHINDLIIKAGVIRVCTPGTIESSPSREHKIRKQGRLNDLKKR